MMKFTKPSEILGVASESIERMTDQVVDVIEIRRPTSVMYALQLTKIVSKLSPLLGNLFEFRIVDTLNQDLGDAVKGRWIRQDPGFPDARFLSEDFPMLNIGVEIKAWFPFATEITGRFRDSERIFADNLINVAIIAWLPEFVFWGKPKVLKTLIVSGKSIAETRDNHYHKPPHYLVIEPEDTADRTANLQQTNTAGYVFQDEKGKNRNLYLQAEDEIRELGEEFLKYSPGREYQSEMKRLQGKYPYRLDTNYAKIDRIQHYEIERFKISVEQMMYMGKPVKEWKRLMALDNDDKELIAAVEELMRD